MAKMVNRIVLIGLLCFLNQVNCHSSLRDHSSSTSDYIFGDSYLHDSINNEHYDQQKNNIASLARGSSSVIVKSEPRIWSSSSSKGSKIYSHWPTLRGYNSPIGLMQLTRSKRSSSTMAYNSNNMQPPQPNGFSTPLQPLMFWPPPPPNIMPVTNTLVAAASAGSLSPPLTPGNYLSPGPEPTDENNANLIERRRLKYRPANQATPYKPNGYNSYQEDCQYHTLVNGDSEIILRKLLPIRLVGRTIVRHCIEKPNLNDPRYKVLLKGNNKSSFGSIRFQMVQ